MLALCLCPLPFQDTTAGRSLASPSISIWVLEPAPELASGGAQTKTAEHEPWTAVGAVCVGVEWRSVLCPGGVGCALIFLLVTRPRPQSLPRPEAQISWPTCLLTFFPSLCCGRPTTSASTSGPLRVSPSTCTSFPSSCHSCKPSSPSYYHPTFPPPHLLDHAPP